MAGWRSFMRELSLVFARCRRILHRCEDEFPARSFPPLRAGSAQSRSALERRVRGLLPSQKKCHLFDRLF